MKRSQLREIIREELANRPVQQVKEVDLGQVAIGVAAASPGIAALLKLAQNMYKQAKTSKEKTLAGKVLAALQQTGSEIKDTREY